MDFQSINHAIIAWTSSLTPLQFGTLFGGILALLITILQATTPGWPAMQKKKMLATVFAVSFSIFAPLTTWMTDSIRSSDAAHKLRLATFAEQCQAAGGVVNPYAKFECVESYVVIDLQD